ncbi:hypothetical protein VOLCADRAFT_107290 [Volvox carteri f. nagariensis]|uniref:Uncharacterized protein n=1 Tax=Volvox carteri f. nagariensis TaxID=3068 RepID=D8UD13_VOLCA|nr:uncharacterized protein VOLCADRAFT_107290 [Volvox carteri f. nagariensis]EFJ42315.1 hypothetical protein VOLCADRAFT_107290 [Volvox carteri f. nagariensis]|eukprot:XP_002956548.1 hypothetical protein VOLCADRAFT_107290 [Volvox carteri f. nagariensis]
MANVYRVHALALTAQGKFEEAQAHGNMCIHLRSEAARKNPNSPAIASANMCLAASYVGMRLYGDAEELLRQAVDICVAVRKEQGKEGAKEQRGASPLGLLVCLFVCLFVAWVCLVVRMAKYSVVVVDGAIR